MLSNNRFFRSSPTEKYPNKLYLFINSAQNHLDFMFYVVDNLISLGL